MEVGAGEVAEAPARPQGSVASDAASVAAGSGIVFAAGIFDQAVRLLVTWTLARTLGADAFGQYTYAVTLVTLIGTFAPVGLQTGVVLYVARYAASGERGRQKGALVWCLALSAVFGVLGAVGLAIVAALAPLDEGLRTSMLVASPGIAVMAVALVLVGTLRAAKDMRAQAVAFQGVLPLSLLVGSLVATAAGGSANAVIVAFSTSYLACAVAAGVYAWRRYGALVSDRSVPAEREVRELLAFSVPQGVTDILYRLTLWMDVLMLGWLASLEDVGLYRVAASLAMINAVPVFAVNTMFNPVVAELVYLKEMSRLDDLLKVLTRWLVLLATPIFLTVLLLPDVFLGAFDPAYVRSGHALVVLMAGQAVHTVCAVSIPLIPMSGRSRLEMVNGAVALVVNVALNLLLVPTWGALGAATASATSISVWAALRVIESWVLFRTFPFDRRSGGLLGIGLAGGTLAAVLGRGTGVEVRLAVTVALLSAFCVLAWKTAITDEDARVWTTLRGRVRQKLGF